MTCRKHIIPTLGSLRLKDLHAERIQRLYIQKTQEGCGDRTIKMIHSVLHSSLKKAVRLGMLGRNPTDAVTPPRYEHEEMRFYDEAQVNQFLFAAKGNRNEALYYLAVTTGLRQSELLGLKWSDLDWVKKTLSVQRQLRREFKQGDYFTTPKTKAGKRTIVLGEKTIEILHEHWDLQNQERRFAGGRWKENDLIFTSSIGTPMDQRNLYHTFREFIHSVGLPEIRFHDLRHTAASLMLNHGIAPIIVSKRLGHSKVSITLDIYGHLMSEMQNEAADLMDELITSVPIELHPVAPRCTRGDD
jgi:integrase